MTIIKGKIKKKAGRGRPRTRYIKQITQDKGKFAYRKIKVTVMDRDKSSKSLNQSKY